MIWYFDPAKSCLKTRFLGWFETSKNKRWMVRTGPLIACRMRIIGCKEYFSAADAGENWVLGSQRWFFSAGKSRDSKIVVGTTVFQWRLELFRPSVPCLCLHRHCGDGFVAEARLRGLSQGVWPGWHEKLSFKYEKAVPFQFWQWTVHLQMLRSISFEMNQLKNSAQEFCLPQCDTPFVASQHVCLTVVRIEFCRVCLLLDFSVQIHLIFSSCNWQCHQGADLKVVWCLGWKLKTWMSDV